MPEIQQTVSPVDGRVLVERPLAEPPEVEQLLDRAVGAQRAWAEQGLEVRSAAVAAFVDQVLDDADAATEELTWQMGRPIAHAPGELSGFADRARAMIRLAPEALADLVPPERPGFERFVRREPLGVVLVLAPWNYPYLTAVNTLVPALLAGNSVLLKHSDQTPLVAERLTAAAAAAGLPEGLLHHVHMTHDLTARVVADPRVAFVAFTGSVAGGRAVHRAAGGHLKAVGLELGGKDPAWVRADAPLESTVANLVDGAFFNAGQSCCGIERIYVHRDRYDAFVEAFAARVQGYVLGDPTDPATTLGPVVRTSSAMTIRAQVDQALRRGARDLVDRAGFDAATPDGPYLPPRVLVDVSHEMAVMREETFGPVVGIMPAADDDEAVRLMDDSPYGLTASIWTADLDAARAIGARLHTGTVFANRCDHLDPELAWAGVELSGRGATLSTIGFEQLTRPKSFHLRGA